MSKNDIYWTVVCIQSLKSRNDGTFNYALYHIIDKSRAETLKQIYALLIDGNERVRRTIDNYSTRMPIIVA